MTSMNTGFRFRAYPDDHVAGVLARWIGCQRFIKNAKVREDRYFRAFQRRFAAFAGQHAPVDQAYAHLIGDGNAGPLNDGERSEADTTWLREVPSPVLRNGAVRFYKGYSPAPQCSTHSGGPRSGLEAENSSTAPAVPTTTIAATKASTTSQVCVPPAPTPPPSTTRPM